MEFFSHRTTIDFIARRSWALLVSALILVASVVLIGFRGLNLGLDFTGGIQLELFYKTAPDLNELRTRLKKAGLEATVHTYGSSTDVIIKLKNHPGMTEQQLTVAAMNKIPEATLHRSDVISAQVGKILITNGILSVIIALLGMMIYIACRFEYRFALSAALSLIHDSLLILGTFSLFKIEFDWVGLAAILTVIGYSLNDTIVLYDRMRENFRKLRKATPYEILNLSVNQILSRTIKISSITFAVVTALLIFGGQMLCGFSLAMMVGIVVGTYSSIYIAGSLALLFGLDRQHLVKSERN